METQANIAKPRFNIGFSFLCLGVLVALITSVTSFLNLVFETLDQRFPDVLNSTYQYGYYTYQYEGIRMALAILIIFFPIFWALSYYLRKWSSRGIGSVDETIKKYLMYVILTLSTLIVAIDLVTLVKYFISGEITSRFIFKVLTVLIVAGLVGSYYIFLLKGKEAAYPQVPKIFAGLGIILVIISICYSFSIIGSPAKQRNLRLDQRRIEDLQSMQYQIISFWQQKEKLPASLEEMKDPISGWFAPVDPEFEKGKKYEYAVKGPLEFELCATFSEAIPEGWQEYGGKGMPPMPYYGRDMAVSSPYPGGGMNESWDHEAGRTCFSRTIDKDIYPPFPKPTR